MMPNFTFSIATSTFIGQNIGAKKMDCVQKAGSPSSGHHRGDASTLSILIAGRPLLRMFWRPAGHLHWLRHDKSILCRLHRHVSTQVYSGILRGARDTLVWLYISIITTVIRCPWPTSSPDTFRWWPHGSPFMLSFPRNCMGASRS